MLRPQHHGAARAPRRWRRVRWPPTRRPSPAAYGATHASIALPHVPLGDGVEPPHHDDGPADAVGATVVDTSGAQPLTAVAMPADGDASGGGPDAPTSIRGLQ